MPETHKENLKENSPPKQESSKTAKASTPTSTPTSPTPPVDPSVPRVLVVDQSLPNRRLISEILTSFHRCEVDACASAEHAFERILQYSYDLFIFAFSLPDMSGLLLDRLAARVHPLIHTKKATAPAVIFLVHSSETAAYKEAQRDARTRGSVPIPLSLDVLMNLAGPLLPPR